MMPWVAITATLVASLIAILALDWIARRGRPRKGLQWVDNSPRKPARIIGR
jgi:hypothetical protein